MLPLISNRDPGDEHTPPVRLEGITCPDCKVGVFVAGACNSCALSEEEIHIAVDFILSQRDTHSRSEKV
jgi:Fe-S cluster biogenesis protein NfuA